MSFDDRFIYLREDNSCSTKPSTSPSACRMDRPSPSSSLRKAIKIYGRLKPPMDPRTPTCPYQITERTNDDGSKDNILVLNPNGEDYDGSNNSVNVNIAAGLFQFRYKFKFTKVFETNSTQDDVFAEMCQPVLESALEGYNSTIFAYGQTGSGKTYTMTGSRHKRERRGIIPRALAYIFDKFSSFENEGHIVSAYVSYLEIYNETGRDLLQVGYASGKVEDLKNVQLFEDAQQQFHMKNVSIHPVKSEEDAIQLLYLGDHNRVIAETPMNEASTRSHCIFTIYLNVRRSSSSKFMRSKVHLVDLAGSERLAHSNTKGQLFNDACNINLALHYLEHVIVALGESNRSHIPYRNSMMTSILKDSLGGNCMTAMVATLSLEYRNILESIQTCRFSQRVALVTNTATPNEETDTNLLIAQLKKENKKLRNIIGKSPIRKGDNDSEPLSPREVGDCLELVENFLADPDEQVVLPVAPDMRLVQTCFQCLKKTVEYHKRESKKVTLPQKIEINVPNYNPKSDDFPWEEYTSREQLIKCLRIRDEDIQSYKKILDKLRGKKPKSSCSCLCSHSKLPTVPSTSVRPKTRSSRERLRPAIKYPDFSDEDDDDTEDDNDDHDHLSRRTISVEKSPPESGNDNDIDNDSIAKMEFHCKLVSSDPSRVFTEGFSESKKNALETFTKSYKGYEELQSMRDHLFWKKGELESRTNLLRRNQAHLKQLKMDMITSKDAGREEDIFLKEAVESQTKTIQTQELQLEKGREEIKNLEENLKELNSQLMSDFEKHWNSLKNFKMKAGIPRVSFSSVLLQPSASEHKSMGDVPSSTAMTATKGILKKKEEKKKEYSRSPERKESNRKPPALTPPKRVYQFIPLEN